MSNKYALFLPLTEINHPTTLLLHGINETLDGLNELVMVLFKHNLMERGEGFFEWQ